MDTFSSFHYFHQQKAFVIYRSHLVDTASPANFVLKQVAGVHSEILQDLPDGTISLDELEHKIQRSYGSHYHPRPELICLENTHCSAGGRVLPLQYLQEASIHPSSA